MRRRSDYVRTCIAELMSSANKEENEIDDLQETNLLELIARKEGVTREEAWLRVWPHISKLSQVFKERWPDNEEKVDRKVRHIITNATSKTYPLKYIDKVLQNERQANKQRNRNPRKPRGK